jgi:hypothetical protein
MRTREICLAAIEQDGVAFCFLRPHEQTEELAIAAIRQDPRHVNFVWNKTDLVLAVAEEEREKLRSPNAQQQDEV